MTGAMTTNDDTADEAASSTPQPPANETSPLLRSNTNEDDVENPDRPKGLKFAIVYTCILLGDFFVGYDTSCVTTLTPVISDEFHAIKDVGWYGIADMLALVSSMLFFAQLYSIYPSKQVYLISFLLFAVGVSISASAWNSSMFIIGRAFSGLGSSGIFAGGTIIITNTTALKYRPIFQSISGGFEATAMAVGPLVAGAIADAISWRACFYLGAIVSGLTLCAVGILVPALPKAKSPGSKAGDQQPDFLGVLLFVPASICLVLALQWGGVELPWNSGQVIGLLVAAAILGVAFGAVQVNKGEKAMFPVHLLKYRSVALGSIAQASVAASVFVFDYYLPIFFQAIKGVSPSQSGLMYLPTAGSLAIGVLVAGGITSLTGYYTPVMVVGTVFLAIGAGLLTTIHATTPAISWIVWQLVFGTGAGLFFNQASIAVQTTLPEEFVGTGIVCLIFTQNLSGIIALAISQNLFLGRIVERLTSIIPGLTPEDLVHQGAGSLPKLFPPAYRDAAYEAYEQTIRDVYHIGLVCACLTIVAVGIEWRSVKADKEKSSDTLDEEQASS